MKKFSAKDLLLYNYKCFGCGASTVFKFYLTSRRKRKINYKNIHINKTSIEIDLEHTYASSLSLKIDLKTNSIETSNIKKIQDIMGEWYFAFENTCLKCKTFWYSSDLEFDFEKMKLNAITISFERIAVTDGDKQYYLENFGKEKYSILLLEEVLPKNLTIVNKHLTLRSPQATITFDKTMPMHFFKDKEQFLDHMKAYLILQ